jgi:hypothetical protein
MHVRCILFTLMSVLNGTSFGPSMNASDFRCQDIWFRREAGLPGGKNQDPGVRDVVVNTEPFLTREPQTVALS